MKISGRTIAYLIILLVVFIAGGITFAGAQGFPPNPLPVPVEESGIVEVVQKKTARGWLGSSCDQVLNIYGPVPNGKRLIIEYVAARAWAKPSRRARTPAKISLYFGSLPDLYYHPIAISQGFPVSSSGPITAYVEQGDNVRFLINCPDETGVDDNVTFEASITGRLVPHPHPSMIPTATPPP